MPVNIRLPEEIKKQLQEYANEQHRSLSNLISKICLDWLKEKDSPKDQE